MIIGVDGTGPGDPRTYNKEMGASYVNMLVASYPGSNRHYLRGPTLLGAETRAEAEAVRDLVLQDLAAGDREILLTGYSRGGAAVIAAAQLLQADRRFAELWKRTEPKRPGRSDRACVMAESSPAIACLALFDAVDRSTTVDTSVVPSNVSLAFHAIRRSLSRAYFGNTGLRIEGGGTLVKEFFVTTHAGMGGLPGAGDSLLGPADAIPGVGIYELVARRSLDALEVRESQRVQTWMWRMVSSVRPLGPTVCWLPITTA